MEITKRINIEKRKDGTIIKTSAIDLTGLPIKTIKQVALRFGYVKIDNGKATLPIIKTITKKED